MALQSIKKGTETQNAVKEGAKAWHLKAKAKFAEFDYGKWLAKKLNRISTKGKKVNHTRSF